MKNPDRTDKLLWAGLIGMMLFSFALIPLRVWLINNPGWYALLVGRYTSSIVLGARGFSPWMLLLTAVGAVKFLPIYYALGRKWGVEFADFATQSTPRINRWMMKYMRGDVRPMNRIAAAVTPFTYLPFMYISSNITVLMMAIGKVRLWLVMLLNVLGVLAVNSVMFYLGGRYGEQVLSVIEVINKYALWITVALVVFVVWKAMRQAK